MVGVVFELCKFCLVELIYGVVYGVCGIFDEDFYDLMQEIIYNLEMVVNILLFVFGLICDKLDLKYCQEFFKVLWVYQIGYFFYIGGNDFFDIVCIVNEEVCKVDYDLCCIYILKIIDNDFVENDYILGFFLVVCYVVQVFMGVNFDNVLFFGIYIGVVMGCYVGFFIVVLVLGKKFVDDGLYFIYMFE